MSKLRVYQFENMPKETIWDGALHRTALRSNHSLVTLNWFEPMARRPEPHRHPFDQLSFVLQGALNFEIDGEIVPLEAQSAIWVPPNAWHTAWPIGQTRVLNLDVFAPAREDYRFLAEHQEAPSGGWPD